MKSFSLSFRIGIMLNFFIAHGYEIYPWSRKVMSSSDHFGKARDVILLTFE